MAERIDENLIVDFYQEPYGSDRFNAGLNAIRKLIEVVMLKHFSNYKDTEKGIDLEGAALMAMLDSKDGGKYNPASVKNAPSTYAYGNIRNTIGNILASKEESAKEQFTYLNSDGVVDVMEEVDAISAFRGAEHWGSEIPDFVLKYQDYLTGRVKRYGIKQISKDSAIKLIIYLRCKDNGKTRDFNAIMPDYECDKIAARLYTLCLDLFKLI